MGEVPSLCFQQLLLLDLLFRCRRSCAVESTRDTPARSLQQQYRRLNRNIKKKKRGLGQWCGIRNNI